MNETGPIVCQLCLIYAFSALMLLIGR